MSSKLILAEVVEAYDTIAISMAAIKGGPNGVRTPVAAVFNGSGVELDAKGNPKTWSGTKLIIKEGSTAPQFDAQKFQLLVAQGRFAESDALRDEYTAALDEAEDKGAVSIQDRIAEAALDWAKKAHGVQTVDGNHPYINPEHVSVKPAYRYEGQPTTFVVTMAPVWGSLLRRAA